MKVVSIETPASGRSEGTIIRDVATGAEIQGVKRVTIVLAVGELAKATIELCRIQASTGAARAEFQIADPLDGRLRTVRRIEFADGAPWEG